MENTVMMPAKDYKDTCDKIRELTNSPDLIKSGELVEKINSVFEKGKKSQYDLFWDALQENGNRASYECAFSKTAFTWNDEIYNPKYPIVCGGETTATANKTFYNCPITDTKVPIIIEETRFDTTFGYCVLLKRIPSLTLKNLTRIQNPFQNCRELEELNLYGTVEHDLNLSYSPKLTHDSLMSVINCLKDFSATEETRTLTVGNTNLSKLTSDEQDVARNKGWTLV